MITEPPIQASAPVQSRSTLQFLIKVARPGFWSTSVWFFLLPLQQQWVFNSFSFWVGVLYVTLPLGLVLYGANDLADKETDRLNPRKGNFLFGAKGTNDQLSALPWQILLVQVPFLIAFGAIMGVAQTGIWFAAVCAATAAYNFPRYGTKNWPVVDLLTQSGYLLVFVLSVKLNGVPSIPWYTYVFGALFAMHSHLFGQIMDIGPDRAAGRRTTAVHIGIIPAKILIVLLLSFESALIFTQAGDLLVSTFLVGAAIWFFLDVAFIWRDRSYTPSQMRFFFLGWNAAAILSIPLVWKWGQLAG